MSKTQTFHEGQRISVDGVTAVILEVLSSQLYVEFDDGKFGVQGFVIIKDHRIEIDDTD